MGGNGLNVVSTPPTADIDFNDGTDIYGFRYALFSKLERRRGSNFAGQISSGGQTYDDATPFKRFVMDNFLGGMGQLSYNKVNGGFGLGGDDSKYFYADAKTDRGGYLLPGAARNLVCNGITKTPISNGLDPLGGDEWEIPRGVVPWSLGGKAWNGNVTCTITGTPTIANIRVLVFLPTYTAADQLYTVTLVNNSTTHNYSGTVLLTDVPKYTGWKWVTCARTGGTGVMVAGNATLTFSASTLSQSAVYGCSIGPGDAVQPYFQLMTSATPLKNWSGNLTDVQHINDSAGNYANIAMLTATNMTFLNLGGNMAAVGTAAGSPERTYGAGLPYRSSLWFNNKLYVSTPGGVFTMSYAAATGTGAFTPTDALDVSSSMYLNTSFGGKIYGITGNGLSINRWDGTFPIGGGNLVSIVTADSIGIKGTLMNKLFIFQGNLWVIKPEGLFQLYADPSTISTAVGNLPRINPIGEPMPSIHPDTGKWYCQFNGSIYFNYRDRICQVTPQANAPTQVTWLTLPIPWYRLTHYHYVNGITTDGVNLYASWNNLGVYCLTNQVWHPVCEFYELVSTEGRSSGLKWVPNPTSGPDSLFVGDGNTIIQLPVPSAASPFTHQIFQNHQNKCGYFISSGWDGEQAEIQKYVHSLVMRAVPSGFSYKVSAVCWPYGPATTPSFSLLIQETWISGLWRDNWVNPFVSPGATNNVVTTKDLVAGSPQPSSSAPACWVSTDFNNIGYSSEKLAVTTADSTTVPPTTDVLTNKPNFVKTAFIVYFWNPNNGQHASTNTNTDPMAIDSIVVKYQAVQDYIPLYKVSLSCQALTEGKKLNLTQSQAEDSWDWLSSQFGRHEPIMVRIRRRQTNYTPGPGISPVQFETFYGFLQNPVDVYGQPLTHYGDGSPLPERVDFDIIGVDGLYTNV